ncbi:MAG: hypothetical protein IJD57_00005, partial [Candidatus Gastranaerophilales bacterium]|nr:hypothetical protein [Candidatus Gastranaerophilales bacterium]
KILLVLLLIFLGHNAFAMYCWDEISGQFSHESKMTEKLGASNIVKVSTMLTAAGATLYECKHAQEGESRTDNQNNYDTNKLSLWVPYGGYTTATNAALNSGSTSATYVNHYNCSVLSTVNGKFQIYGNNFEDYPVGTTVTNSASGGPSITKPGVTTGRLYTYIYAKGEGAPFEQNMYACNYSTTYAYYCHSSYNDNFLKMNRYYYTKLRYYVLHNPHFTHTFCTTVGGGGGGAAGAAVNYIIKAD